MVMLQARLVPAMLICGGRLVKGRQFMNHEDAGSPATTAKIYNDQMADEILVLDIQATPKNRVPDVDTLRQLSERCFVPISFGGGVTSTQIGQEVFRAGADKIVLNAAAIAEPKLISNLADLYGRQAVVVAIDVRDTEQGPRVVTDRSHSITEMDPARWAEPAVAHGAGEILLTSVDREGTRSGIDVQTTRAVVEAVDVPVIAHGGVGQLEDFVTAIAETGAAAVAAGRIFQFADNNLIKVRRYMQGHGIHLRNN